MSVSEIRNQALACELCRADLPNEPKPIFIWPDAPSIILISQAPGRLAHNANLAWKDASGERLRSWLGVDSQQFYSSGKFAVLPMSFCFPGYKNGADAPPLKICAATWHERFLSQCSAKLVVCIGRYAQQHYLPEYATLTEGVHDFEGLLPNKIVLPHPSGRNNRWLSKHDWFATGLVPKLKQRINELM